MRSTLACCCGVCLGVWLSFSASAQAPVPAAGREMESVVVTATRRNVDLDQIPIAVTEVGGDTLQDHGIRDTQSLQMEVPSLVITVSGSESAGAVIRVRGIGTSGGNPGFESSVGVFVDGVYLSRPGIALTDLIDVDRIEVLRGPQGTLFGKNTSVGAINILTQRPGFEAEAELGASYGNFDAKLVRGMLNLPLLDERVALRLSGQYHQRDGYIHNDHDGEDYNDRDRYSLRGQLLFQLSDDASLRLIAENLSKDERCCAAPYTQYGGTAAVIEAMGGTVYDPPEAHTVAFDRELGSDFDDVGYSAHLDWDLGGTELRALMSFRDSEIRDRSDGDYSDLDIAYTPYQNADIAVKTAELSLHGVVGALDWVAGLYGSDEDIDVASSTLFGEDAALYVTLISGGALPGVLLYPNGAGQTDVQAWQRGKSWSVFSHNIFRFGDGYDLTLGLRYLDEQKDGGGYADADSPSCTTPGIPASGQFLCGAEPYTAAYDDDRITGTAAIGRLFAGGQYLYASYSSGFKSGGVNLNPPTTAGGGDTQFQPEVVDSYEIGFKAPFFSHALQTRTALFWMDIDDFQVAGYNGNTWEVATAPVRSRGVEFESTLFPAQGLVLRAAFTYADARFRGNVSTIATELDGETVTNAPRWSGQFSAGYDRELGWAGARVFSHLSARYQSEVNTGVDLDPAKRQGGYTLVNARLGLGLSQDFDVSFWGSNLTDEHYRVIIFNSPAQSGSYNGYPGLPRTYGVELNLRF